jgi:acetylornithine/succinyldiaminopimelate/putrescine aminotransferase
LQRQLPVIREVRGQGLMMAAELTVPGKSVTRDALAAGVLMNCTQEKVLRFLPPLTVERQHVDELMGVLHPILAALPAGEKKGVPA